MNRQYQKTLTFRLKGTLCICKFTMQIIPFHFLCVRDWFHRGVLCTISSVYDHTPTSHLRLKIAVGGTRHSGWKKRYWPCAIIRGADTHCWQSLEHGLGVTITLALLSRIRTVPVKPSHDRNCQHLFIFAFATAADNSSIVSNKGPDPWSLLGVCWR